MKKILVLCLLATIGGMYFSNGITAGSKPFSQEVEHKLKVMFYSDLSSEQLAEFRRYLIEEDVTNVLNMQDSPRSFDESDVVLYLLNSFADAKGAPGKEFFPTVMEDVVEDKASVKMVFKLVVNGERPLLLVFYNRSATPNASLKCYAKEFLEGLVDGDSEISTNITECN